jgi:hypothetical protein
LGEIEDVVGIAAGIGEGERAGTIGGADTAGALTAG